MYVWASTVFAGIKGINVSNGILSLSFFLSFLSNGIEVTIVLWNESVNNLLSLFFHWYYGLMNTFWEINMWEKILHSQ